MLAIKVRASSSVRANIGDVWAFPSGVLDTWRISSHGGLPGFNEVMSCTSVLMSCMSGISMFAPFKGVWLLAHPFSFDCGRAPTEAH